MFYVLLFTLLVGALSANPLGGHVTGNRPQEGVHTDQLGGHVQGNQPQEGVHTDPLGGHVPGNQPQEGVHTDPLGGHIPGNQPQQTVHAEEGAQLCGNQTECTYSGHDVICKGPGVKEIPSDCPADITSFDLQNTIIKMIPDRAFDKYTCLTKITFSGNDLQSIAKGAFSGLPNLETLILAYNELPDVNSKDVPFEDLSSLKSVSLINNKLTIFPLHLFANAHGLETFSVFHNQISDMGPKINFSLQNLTDIDLSFNKLTSVNASMFHQMPNIVNLDLNFNKITVIHNGRAFMDMPSLQKLDLKENTLHCDCQALWIVEAREAGKHWAMAWDTDPLECESPSWMDDMDITKLYPEDLTCEPPIITPITSTNITRTKDTQLKAMMKRGMAYSTWVAPDGKTANDNHRGITGAKSDIENAFVRDTIEHTNLSTVVTTLDIYSAFEITGQVKFTLMGTNAGGNSSITFWVSAANGGPPMCRPTAIILLLLICSKIITG